MVYLTWLLFFWTGIYFVYGGGFDHCGEKNTANFLHGSEIVLGDSGTLGTRLSMFGDSTHD